MKHPCSKDATKDTRQEHGGPYGRVQCDWWPSAYGNQCVDLTYSPFLIPSLPPLPLSLSLLSATSVPDQCTPKARNRYLMTV